MLCGVWLPLRLLYSMREFADLVMCFDWLAYDCFYCCPAFLPRFRCVVMKGESWLAGFVAVGFFAVRYEDLLFFFEATLLETAAYLRRERGSLPVQSSGETACLFYENCWFDEEEWI